MAGETLYVADTENHAIRAVDLASGAVRTVAGTGEQGSALHAMADGRATALSSPWDVATHDRTLYIAMSGTHQICRLDLNPRARAGRLPGSDGRVS